jgi:hypothetical protein
MIAISVVQKVNQWLYLATLLLQETTLKIDLILFVPIAAATLFASRVFKK